MTFFPKEVFTNILSYCDDRIEKKQRYLWSKIKPHRELDLETCETSDPFFYCDYWFYDELSGQESNVRWEKYGLLTYDNDVLSISWDECYDEWTPHYKFI